MTVRATNSPQPTYVRDQNSHIAAEPVRNGRWSAWPTIRDGLVTTVSLYHMTFSNILAPMFCSTSKNPIAASLTYPLAAFSITSFALMLFFSEEKPEKRPKPNREHFVELCNRKWVVKEKTLEKIGIAALGTGMWHGFAAVMQGVIGALEESSVRASFQNLIIINLATTVFSVYVTFKAWNAVDYQKKD